MTTFNNKTILITGASSGLGRATAIKLAGQGANLVLGARRQALLDETVKDISQLDGKAVALAGDVQSENYARQLVEIALDNFGGLDAAFNNAGTLGEMGSVTDMTSDNWQETINTNLTSAFYGAKYQIPAIQKCGAGSILFTGTFVGHTAGMPGMAAYAASKAGLVGLTQTLAAELGSENIRVNCLLAGGIDTPMGRVVANSPEALQYVKSLHALQRIATPDEVAEVACFLLSEQASFITGSALLADGGVSIYR